MQRILIDQSDVVLVSNVSFHSAGYINWIANSVGLVWDERTKLYHVCNTFISLNRIQEQPQSVWLIFIQRIRIDQSDGALVSNVSSNILWLESTLSKQVGTTNIVTDCRIIDYWKYFLIVKQINLNSLSLL